MADDYSQEIEFAEKHPVLVGWLGIAFLSVLFIVSVDLLKDFIVQFRNVFITQPGMVKLSRGWLIVPSGIVLSISMIVGCYVNLINNKGVDRVVPMHFNVAILFSLAAMLLTPFFSIGMSAYMKSQGYDGSCRVRGGSSNLYSTHWAKPPATCEDWYGSLE